MLNAINEKNKITKSSVSRMQRNYVLKMVMQTNYNSANNSSNLTTIHAQIFTRNC